MMTSGLAVVPYVVECSYDPWTPFCNLDANGYSSFLFNIFQDLQDLNNKYSPKLAPLQSKLSNNVFDDV